MPTQSSDAIDRLGLGDPDPAPAPPRPPVDPGPHEPSALDEAPLVLPRLDESASGEVAIGQEIRSGSSTFDVPSGLVAPDPIVRALSEPPPPRAEWGEAGPAPVSVSTASGDPLGAFRLDHDAPAASAPAGRPAPAGGMASGDDVAIEYVNGPNWPMVLLASYASAVTLALIWWVILPRFRGRGELDDFSAPPPTAVGERRADRSRQVEPAQPIPAERVTTLGRPLKVGALEITPVDVARSAVRLRRASLSGKVEEKDGGQGAMALRLRLRNTSQDLVFAPLDEAFVRDRDDGISESFVELDDGRRIYLYPLPVSSEWSVVGQSFPDLKPGEAKEVRIVTAAEFPPASSGMTWRLKLRTGLKETATVGVTVPGAE